MPSKAGQIGPEIQTHKKESSNQESVTLTDNHHLQALILRLIIKNPGTKQENIRAITPWPDGNKSTQVLF